MLMDKKGTVLVVAVTAMMVMIIIGLVCLQIYTNQSLLDTYDQIKQRTFYSAEAGVEMMRGYIDKKIDETSVTTGNERGDSMYGNRGFLAFVTKVHGSIGETTNWEPFKEGTTSPYARAFLKDVFDGTMHPSIQVEVHLHRLNALDFVEVHNNRGITFRDGGTNIDALIFASILTEILDFGRTYRGYEIVSTATAFHKTTMGTNYIKTTLRYYFYTKREQVDVEPGVVLYKNNIKWVGWRRD